MENDNFILNLYESDLTVFKISDAALLMPNANKDAMSERLSYYVKKGNLIKLRRGIYAKPHYDPLELANAIFTPSYISLEYVLQRAGIIFQYDTKYTLISYLSRTIKIDEKEYNFRRIKPEILTNPIGIIRNRANYNRAIPERAFLDILYLNNSYYFDHLEGLDKEKIESILPIYKNEVLKKNVKTILSNV